MKDRHFLCCIYANGGQLKEDPVGGVGGQSGATEPAAEHLEDAGQSGPVSNHASVEVKPENRLDIVERYLCPYDFSVLPIDFSKWEG